MSFREVRRLPNGPAPTRIQRSHFSGEEPVLFWVLLSLLINNRLLLPRAGCYKKNYLPQVKPSGFCMYLSVFWYWRSCACMPMRVMMMAATPPVMPRPQYTLGFMLAL